MFDKTENALYDFDETDLLPKKCGICQEALNKPLILSCLHIFDRDCLTKREEKDGLALYIKCPTCSKLSGGVKTLKPFDHSILQDDQSEDNRETPIKCTICTEGNEAMFRCINCAGTLCTQCKTIHKIVKFFSDHEVIELTEVEKVNPRELFDRMKNSKPVYCKEHPDIVYSLFCMQCHVPMCHICMNNDHKSHINCDLNVVADRFKPMLSKVIQDSRQKRSDLIRMSSDYQLLLPEVNVVRNSNKETIENLYDNWIMELKRAKELCLEKNDKFHENAEMKIWSRINKISKIVDQIDYSNEFTKSYFEKCSNLEMCELANLLINCFESHINEEIPETIQSRSKFKTCHLAIKDILASNFGYFDHEINVETTLTDERIESKRSVICNNKSPSESGFEMSDSFKRLSMKSESDVLSMFMLPSGNMQTSPNGSQSSRGGVNNMLLSSNGQLGSTGSNQCSTNIHSILSSSNSQNWNSGLNGLNGLDPSISPDFDNNSNHHLSGSNFDSNGIHSLIENNVLGNGGSLVSANGNGNLINSLNSNPGPIVGLNSHHSVSNPGMLSLADEPFGLRPGIVNPVKPPNGSYTPSLYEYSRLRNARCSQMSLLVKWGNMGCELGRLNSPHGFCLGFDEEIVVADTHNHRIQTFSKRGQFQSFFGVSGRVDGLLWYPRKVAIIRQSQRYVVCDRGNERSRMQLFSRSGHFVRRIAIRYIDIVAGLAINQHGHIVAIDSVSPSVFVVSEEGDLIKWFDCSNYMREPSDVAIHGREYYICDFKAHCVVVFQEDGKFVRRIGGETITDYPNGIDVSDHGDVLVGDSHGNRFHIAVFNRTGELQCEFVCNQTKVSRSSCLKITTEGYVVTLARSSNNVLVIDTLYVC